MPKRGLALSKWVVALVCAVNAFLASPPPAYNGKGGRGLLFAQPTGKPMITALSPNKGANGTMVNIRGRNFTLEDNTVQFRGEKSFAADSPVESKNGTRLQFRITTCPSYQPQCPGFYVPPGVYHVTVINKGGESNSVSFSLVLPTKTQ
jgi:hypothetical protein